MNGLRRAAAPSRWAPRARTRRSRRRPRRRRRAGAPRGSPPCSRRTRGVLAPSCSHGARAGTSSAYPRSRVTTSTPSRRERVLSGADARVIHAVGIGWPSTPLLSSSFMTFSPRPACAATCAIAARHCARCGAGSRTARRSARAARDGDRPLAGDRRPPRATRRCRRRAGRSGHRPAGRARRDRRSGTSGEVLPRIIGCHGVDQKSTAPSHAASLCRRPDTPGPCQRGRPRECSRGALVTLLQPGRSNPGSIFCRYERPCAERRSAVRHLSFPGCAHVSASRRQRAADAARSSA